MIDDQSKDDTNKTRGVLCRVVTCRFQVRKAYRGENRTEYESFSRELTGPR